MTSDDNKTKDIWGILRTGLVFLLLQFLLSSFKSRLPESMSSLVSIIIIFGFLGYINFRYNKTMTYLFNLNPISPPWSDRFIRFLGLFFILLSIIFCIVLIIRLIV